MHYTTSCNTQSSAPKDGRNHRPKCVELIGINNKPLLLYLVGCLHYLYQRCAVKQISDLLGMIEEACSATGKYEIDENRRINKREEQPRMRSRNSTVDGQGDERQER